MPWRDATPDEVPAGAMRDATPDEIPDASQLTAQQPQPSWVNQAIDFGYDGASSPVMPPDAYIQRMTQPQNPWWERLGKALVSGAKEGFGDDSQVGIRPGSDEEKEMIKFGILQDPSKPASLRLMGDAVVRPVAAMWELAGRIFAGGTGAVSEAIGEAADITGVESKNVAKENAQAMLDWFAARGDAVPAFRHGTTPDGKPVDIEVGLPPSPQTFMDATRALTGGKASPEIATKLSELYEEHGIHPAEAVHDAQENPAIMDALVSSNPDAKPDEPGIPPNKEPEMILPPTLSGPGKGGGGGGSEPPEGGGGVPAPNPEGGDLGGFQGKFEPTKNRFQDAADRIMSKISIGENTDEKVPYTWSKFYTATIDKFHPWLDAIRQSMSPDALRDLATADNPYRLARLFPGWQWTAHGFLNDGVRDFYSGSKAGESFRSIMADVRKVTTDIPGYSAEDEFRVFVASARARELYNRDIEVPFEDEDTLALGRALAPKYGDLERRLVEYQNRVAAYGRDAGIISKAGYAAMIEANKFHVPFFRVVGRAAKATGAKLSQSFEANNPFFEIEGSDKGRIVDPLESVIKNTYLITQMAQKNVAATKMIDLLLQRDRMVKQSATGRALSIPDSVGSSITEFETPERAAIIEALQREDGFQSGSRSIVIRDKLARLEPEEDAGTADPAALADTFEPLLRNGNEDTVTILRDGQKHTYTVDGELARSMKQLDVTTTGWLAKWLSYPASTLRAGAVLSPDFWVRHSFRDYLYAFTSTVGGVFTPLDMMKGMAAFAVHSEDFWKYSVNIPGFTEQHGALFSGLRDQFWDAMHHGAGGTSFLSFDRAGIQSDLQKLTDETGLMTRSYNVVMDPGASVWEKGKALGGIPVGAVKNLYHGAQFITEMVTSASHLGAYIRDQRLNGVQKEASKALTIPELKGKTMQPAEGWTTADAANAYSDVVRLPHVEGRALADAQAKDVERARLGELDTRGNYASFGFRGKGNATQPEMPSENPPRLDTPEKRSKLHSAWVARDTSIDAQRIGAAMKAYNMISAFANIKIQESDKLIQGLRSNPLDMGMKIAVGVTLPSMLLWTYNHDKSWYQDTPDWQKNMFWLVHIPKWVPATPEQVAAMKPDMVRLINGQLMMDNAVTFRIPKPFTMGVVFGSGPERMLDAWYRDRPKEVSEWLKAVGESTIGDVLPTAGLPVAEQWGNRSFLTGGRLVPDRLQENLPEYQYTDYTSPTAKALGRIIGSVPYIGNSQLGGSAFASPMVIANYVRQYTGTLGQYAMQLADTLGQKAGVYDKPADTTDTWSDIDFIKSFTVRNPSMGAQPIQDFYDSAEHVQEVQSTYKRLMKDGDLDAATKLAASGGDELILQLGDYKKALNSINAMVHQINGSGELKPYEKRQLIDSLYYQAINIADQGNTMIKQAHEAIEKAQQ